MSCEYYLNNELQVLNEPHRKMLSSTSEYVVPVIVVREGTFQGISFTGNCLSLSANNFNDRAIVDDHPSSKSMLAGDNKDYLDRMKLGRCYSSKYDSRNKRIVANFHLKKKYLNYEDRQNLRDRIENGGKLEVSMGVTWGQSSQSNKPDFLNVDHIALFKDSSKTGACSSPDGNRIAHLGSNTRIIDLRQKDSSYKNLTEKKYALMSENDTTSVAPLQNNTQELKQVIKDAVRENRLEWENSNKNQTLQPSQVAPVEAPAKKEPTISKEDIKILEKYKGKEAELDKFLKEAKDKLISQKNDIIKLSPEFKDELDKMSSSAINLLHNKLIQEKSDENLDSPGIISVKSNDLNHKGENSNFGYTAEENIRKAINDLVNSTDYDIKSHNHNI